MIKNVYDNEDKNDRLIKIENTYNVGPPHS